MKGVYKLGVVVLVLLAITTTASAFTEIGDNITVANNVTAQNFLGYLNWGYLLGIPTDFPNSTVASYNGNFPNNTVAGYGNNFPNTTLSNYGGNFPNTSLPNYLLISTYGTNFPNATLGTYNGNFPNNTLAGYNNNFPNTSLPNYLLISTYGGNFPNSTLASKEATWDAKTNFSINASGNPQIYSSATLAAGTNISLNQNGNTITISSTGGAVTAHDLNSTTYHSGYLDYVRIINVLVNLANNVTGQLQDANIASAGTWNAKTTLAQVNQSANLYNVNGANITSGTIPTARYMDAVNASANLYNVNGANITSGTIPTARYLAAVNNTALLASIAQVTGLDTALAGKEPTITTLSIAKGGTGQTTQTAAFNALDPLTTKGDIIVNDGTNSVRLPVGSDGQALIANSTAPNGVNWDAPNYRNLVTLNSDVASTASTAFQDVTGLSFPVTAGTTYRFKATIIYTASATTVGSRWAVNGPASPTLLAYNSVWTLTATTNSAANAAAYDTGTASATSATTAGNIATVEGIIIPSASGTFIIRFAPETATASGTVVKAGSTLEWW